MSTENEADLRDTTPPPPSQTEPSALSEGSEPLKAMPPPALVPVESIEPPGYDPDKWEHYKIARMVESLATVRAGLEAVSPTAQEGLIRKVADEVAARFRPIVEAAERRIMGEVHALERGQNRANDDVAELRAQFTQLERRLTELETRAKEGANAAETTTAPTPG